MFGSPTQGAHAYAKVGVETGVLAATPHQLIVMLFDGASVAMQTGRAAMKAGNIEEKNRALSKAVNIVAEGLSASLDRSKGGELANNLSDLYQYICQRIMEANIRNDSTMLDEAHNLLADLGDAWKSIGKGSPAANTGAHA